MNYVLPSESLNTLKNIAYDCLLSLSTEEGIYASSRQEAYGCIFGRDSAITILKLLNVYAKNHEPKVLDICRRTLLTLIGLQGKEYNVESGEEPGKFIHEFRKDNYERLIARKKPWFVYPDGTLKNYDSIDSTPLILIAIYNYWKSTGDVTFLLESLASVEMGLHWIMGDGDKDHDFLMEYEVHESRVSGGLVVQSWTDSFESMMRPDGTFPKYPIAPVEVQGIAWLALTMWSEYYATSNELFSRKLKKFTDNMKKSFTQNFIIQDSGVYFAAQALDGSKNKIATVTANPLVCLWATYEDGNIRESIIEDRFVDDFVKRAFLPDLFDEDAGIRTMSVLSPTYNAGTSSYHNGSFWPMLNGLIHEGLQRWGYEDRSNYLMQATLKPMHHFGFPIELYTKDEMGNYLEYESSRGKKGCRYQAWSAAAALDLLT